MRIDKLLFHAKYVKLFSVTSLIIFASSISVSTYASERKTYTTIGNRDCKEWTVNRYKSLSGNLVDNISTIHDTAWFLGYISSLNGAMGGDVDILTAVDADTVSLWVDRYCAQNPTNDLADAAYELFIELQKIETNKLESKKKKSSR